MGRQGGGGGGGGLIHNKECEDEEVSFIEATRENQENIQRSMVRNFVLSADLNRMFKNRENSCRQETGPQILNGRHSKNSISS